MKLSESEIYEKICALLEEMFEINPTQLTPDTHLYEELDIDSIDAVDMLLELKKLTGRKFSTETFQNVRTLQQMVDAVSQQLAALDDTADA
jgi:acyl carrier protein